jgi:pimeloyl-ACP methyl ester carboxylesterase
MSDYVARELNYYKIQIAKEKGRNQGIDPLNRFPLRLSNIPTDFDEDEGQETERNDPREQFQEFGVFSIGVDVPFRSGDADAIARAYKDENGAFSYYFLPLYLLEESYKNEGERSPFIGEKGMYNLEFESKDLVYYSDYKGGHHIALKGTSDPIDFYSNAFILFRGGDTGAIMGDAQNDWLDIITRYPNRKFNIYGHSLGGSRASILLDQFPDKIERAIVFNMGKSPLGMVGWRPTQKQKNLLHYRMIGDPISQGIEVQEDYNTKLLAMRGRGAIGLAEKIKRYHGLRSFFDWNATFGLDKEAKYILNDFGKRIETRNPNYNRFFEFKGAMGNQRNQPQQTLKALQKRRSGIRGYNFREVSEGLRNVEQFDELRTKPREDLLLTARYKGIPNADKRSTDELRNMLYQMKA